jgi:hypothetical protein
VKALTKRLFTQDIVVVWFVVAVACALYGVFVQDQKASISFLQNFLFWCVGVWLAGAFFLHWIRPTANKICEGLGWPKGSPFQREVTAADGAIGILGIICGFTQPGGF